MRKAVLVVLAVAACAPAPAYRAPEQVPAPRPYTPPAASVPDAQLVGAAFFGDSVLAALVTDAIRGNTDLRQAEARVRRARGVRFGATLDFAPTITGSAGYTRRRIASATFGGAFTIPDQDLYDVGADVSWEVDLFGRLRAQWQGQGALVGAAEEDRRGVLVSLASEVAAAYVDLRGAQARLRVAEKNAENQRRSLTVVRERLDAGRGTALDTERAEAQLRSTLARVPALRAAIRSAQYRLDFLAGRAPQAEPAGALAASAPLPALPDSLGFGDVESLLRRRPDVASAERSYAAQRSFTGAARREYLPRVTVGGNAGFTSLTIDSIGSTGTSRFSIGPVISWPLLNLGRVKSRVEIAAAEEGAAAARYQGAVLAARRELADADVTFRSRLERLADLRAAAEASAKAAELARLRFDSGIADFLQVLDAERVALDAEDQFVLGEIDAVQAWVAAYRAAGGPWTPVP